MMDEWSKAAMRDDKIKKFERVKEKLFDNFFDILTEIDSKQEEVYCEKLYMAGETLELLEKIVTFEKKGEWK